MPSPPPPLISLPGIHALSRSPPMGSLTNPLERKPHSPPSPLNRDHVAEHHRRKPSASEDLHRSAGGSQSGDAASDQDRLMEDVSMDRRNYDLHSSHSHSESSMVKREDFAYPLMNPQPPAGPSTVRRRRAKRTQEERIAYLREDPYVAQYEAYRVLCASCNKWIRLRPNSTYCSIPWDAHRKSCLARKLPRHNSSLDERNANLAKDPDVLKFDAERVLCRICDQWININQEDAIQAWSHHRSICRDSGNARAYGPGTPSSCRPRTSSSSQVSNTSSHTPSPLYRPVASPGPISKGAIILPPLEGNYRPQKGSPALSSAGSSSIYSPRPELRRDDRYHNAHKREEGIRSDPLVGSREKCLLRNSEQKSRKRPLDHSDTYLHSEGSGSDNDRGRDRPGFFEPHRPLSGRNVDARPRRSYEQVDRMLVDDVDSKQRMGDGPPPARQHRMKTSSSWKKTVAPPDLTSSHGRINFVLTSVYHLFSTSYRRTDILQLSSLLTYVNAALPPDKYEEFDTPELARASATLQDKGCIILEGDTIRLPTENSE